MSVAEKVDLDNYLYKIDELSTKALLEIAGDIMDVLRKHELANKFDIGEIIQRPHKWGEFWVPALNGELWEDDETPEAQERTEWGWICNQHFASLFPLSVMENACAVYRDGCSPVWCGSGEREFPFAE
jgi:hypothetical protein